MLREAQVERPQGSQHRHTAQHAVLGPERSEGPFGGDRVGGIGNEDFVRATEPARTVDINGEGKAGS